MSKTYEEIIELDIEGISFECLVSFTFTPGFPGKYDGPPEFCHPEEADEYEIFKLILLGENPQDISCLLSIPFFPSLVEDRLKNLREAGR